MTRVQEVRSVEPKAAVRPGRTPELWGGEEGGQATIEAALTLPVVLVALLLIVEVAVVGRDAMALTQAAREGARALAITSSEGEAVAAVRRAAGPLDTTRIDVEIEPARSDQRRGVAGRVSLRYAEEVELPLISQIVSFRLPLRAAATMSLERDAPTPSPPAPTPSPTPGGPTGTPAPPTPRPSEA